MANLDTRVINNVPVPVKEILNEFPRDIAKAILQIKGAVTIDTLAEIKGIGPKRIETLHVLVENHRHQQGVKSRKHTAESYNTNDDNKEKDMIDLYDVDPKFKQLMKYIGYTNAGKVSNRGIWAKIVTNVVARKTSKKVLRISIDKEFYRQNRDACMAFMKSVYKLVNRTSGVKARFMPDHLMITKR